MHGSLRDKSVHLRHRATGHHAQCIEHSFKKMYREDSFSALGGRCFYCESRLSRGEATADHRIPLSKGGTTSRDNLVMACEPCNKAKGSMSVGKFRNLLNQREPPGWNPRTFYEPMKAWLRYKLNKRIDRMEKRVKKAVGIQ